VKVAGKSTSQYNYSRNWLDKLHQSPERQRWIDRFEEIGYLDQPGVGEPKKHSHQRLLASFLAFP
jgi:hypothetical protein